MKIKRGQEKIGTLQQVSLLVDWNDFLRYQGHLASLDKIERAAGNFLRGLAIFCFSASAVIILLSGNLRRINLLQPSSIPELLPWIGLAILLYAQY
ncbi:hypothetical protein KC640_02370, partial [Candidatus Dojkabacteria bacterium]|nr:hypothetical protein [Candidatus Dojkabacteria bacterium]